MEVDDAVPQEASAEIQSPKRKLIRAESAETQDYVRETLAISRKKERKWASCQAPSANHEGPFIGATADAVKNHQILTDSLTGCRRRLVSNLRQSMQ